MALNEAVQATIIQHLLEASETKLTASDVTPSTTLGRDLALGSLQAVSLMLDLEDALHITVETDELGSLKTVGDLFELIDRKLAAQPTQPQ